MTGQVFFCLNGTPNHWSFRPSARPARYLTGELITDSMERHNIAGIIRTVFDFLAQLGDVHVYRSREREVLVAPYSIQKLIA